MEWMFLPLRRYADFTGRSCRREYWMFALMHGVIGMLLYLPVLTAMAAAPDGPPPAMLGVALPLFTLYVLVMFVPALAVQVRRLHDVGRSGWLLLIGLVPVAGIVILLYLLCQRGTAGPNHYGADPIVDDGILPA